MFVKDVKKDIMKKITIVFYVINNVLVVKKQEIVLNLKKDGEKLINQEMKFIFNVK